QTCALPIFRVGAHRSGNDDLAGSVEPGLFEHVRPHDEIRVPVAPWIGAVRADTSDFGGEMEYELRDGVVEQPFRVGHRGQVVVGLAGDDDLMTGLFKPFDEMRAEEAAASGDEDSHARTVPTGTALSK